MFFGKTASGDVVEQLTLTNTHGVSVDILTLGATIRRFLIPMNQEKTRDIVLGFDDISHYLEDQHYLGCVVGRYANRIHKGLFTLEGETYQADINQAGNCLHGGSEGFNRRIWQVESVSPQKLCLTLESPDDDQGFPGRLKFHLTYTLDDDNSLTIRYQACSDKTTLFNPTQHSYFNLDGHDAGSAAHHELTIAADHILEVDKDGIPSGKLLPVAASVFDFRHAKSVSEAIESNHPLIQQAQGIDHNWCLKQSSITPINASLFNARRDLELQVLTTMPGMQIYTGNFLPESYHGKNGATYAQYQGICLETQYYPDSPNQATFASPILHKGETFISETSYKVIAHQ